jgi:hypothetical protein
MPSPDEPVDNTTISFEMSSAAPAVARTDHTDQRGPLQQKHETISVGTQRPEARSCSGPQNYLMLGVSWCVQMLSLHLIVSALVLGSLVALVALLPQLTNPCADSISFQFATTFGWIAVLPGVSLIYWCYPSWVALQLILHLAYYKCDSELEADNVEEYPCFYFCSLAPFVLSSLVTAGGFIFVGIFVTLFGSAYAVVAYSGTYLYDVPGGLVLPLRPNETENIHTAYSQTLVTNTSAHQTFESLSRMNGINGTFEDYYLRLDGLGAVAAPSQTSQLGYAIEGTVNTFKSVPVVPLIFCGDLMNVGVSCCVQMRVLLLPWLLNGIVVLPVLVILMDQATQANPNCFFKFWYMLFVVGLCVSLVCSVILIPYLMLKGQSLW